MEYVVVKDFSDLQDDGHVYRAGDAFPRNGAMASEERLKELSSKKNKRKEALIKAVEKEEIAEKEEAPAEAVEEEKKDSKRAIKKEK